MSERRPFFRLPPHLIDRAIALIRRGYSVETAAAAAGFTGRALRSHLAARYLDPYTLRGGRPPRIGRVPCRFCDEPVRRRGEVCRSPACRRRAWEELPEAERQAQIDGRRRGDRYARHTGSGRRVDVHVLLSSEEAERLREQAAMRGQSLSSLVAEALAAAGLTGEGGDHALV